MNLKIFLQEKIKWKKNSSSYHSKRTSHFLKNVFVLMFIDMYFELTFLACNYSAYMIETSFPICSCHKYVSKPLN